jgi:SOS-response transcriptional repressor LexA
MIDAAICDEDWVVKQQPPRTMAHRGCLLDDEATVRAFKRTSGHLAAAHNRICDRRDHASILGKVVAVLRRI